MVKIGPVDSKIIGLQEIIKNKLKRKKLTQVEHIAHRAGTPREQKS